VSQREAGIHVTMKSAGFMAGLRTMGTQVQQAGTKMGRALAGPMKAGLNGAKDGMKGLMSDFKGHAKTAATLGGAFAIGSFIQDGIQGQAVYRNIAHEISKVSKETKNWQDVHAMIEPVAEATGQSGDKMAAAFSQMFASTGDLEFSREAMEAIGNAATASGKDITLYGDLAQLAFRKFNVDAKQLPEVLAQLDSQLGVGGAGLEDLSAKFAMMSTEASEAGMGGGAGMVKLLGAMRAVDAEVGEKAPGAFKAMFASLKDGSGALKNLQKNSGVKFTADMDAMDKVKALISTTKGRKTAEVAFTGDTRILFDSLVKPFDAAVKKAKAAGKSPKEAIAEGQKAFDEAMGNMGASTATYADLQKKAADRMKDDPSIIWAQALEKMGDVFGEPQMIEALTRLAKLLPSVAEGFVKLMDFAMKHPLLTAGGFVGAKMAIGFAQGAITDAASRMGASFIASAGPMMATMGITAGTKMGMAAQVALVAAAATIGFLIGKEIANAFFDAREAEEKKGFEAATVGVNALGSKDIGEKNAAVEQTRKAIAALKDQQTGPGAWAESAAGWGASLVDDTITGNEKQEQRARQIANLEAQEKELLASIKKQQEANSKNSASTSQAAADIAALGRAARDAKNAMGAPGAGGPPAPLPVGPGHGGAG